MFTLSNAYDNPKHSKLTRLKNRIKFSTYSIMHELLQCQFESPTLFSLLILVEAGQFLWFAIHPDYSFLWQTSFAQYPRDIVKYLQVDALFREGDVGVYYTVLYLFAGVILAILSCIVFILIKFNPSTKKNSTIMHYLLQLLSLCAVLLITIGPIPLFQTFLEALTCESEDPLVSESQCYKGIHLANTICGALALFFTLGLTTISQLLFIDFNPASKIPFAGPQSIIGFFKLALKFGITLYYTLDHDLSSAKTFVIIYAILWLFTLILRYTSRGYYNEQVNIVATVTECIVTWAAVTCVFHAYVDVGQVDDVGLYFFLCAAPFAGYTYYIIFMSQRLGGMRINIRKMKKIYEIEKFLNITCALVENKEKPQARIELEGVIRYHTKTCRKDPNDCLCYYLSQNIASSDPNGEEKKLWYRFLNSLISDAIVKFPKNCHLRLQHAYFQQDRVRNNFKALFELMKSEEVRPDIQEEFSVFRYKNIIEKEMLEKDMRNANSRGIDVNMIVHFQEKFVVFQKEVGKSVKMQLNFWQELEQSTPNVQQLLGLGSKITVQAEIVKNAYSELSSINSNHIRMLKIYGNFLQDIMNDNFEAQRILEKAEYAEKSMNLDKGFMETDRLKYSENSKTCIIMCSGNIHTMGKVLDANTETMNMLNFSHTEIIGQSVNQIMPEVIGAYHDALMMKYFDTCVPSVIGRERPVFPMNKGGYIIPCSLMIKIYPNLDHGIRVVGFMRRVESNSSVTIKPKVGEEIVMNSLRTHYIMYGGENNEIYAVTEGCYDSFGIPSSLANGTDPEFTIETVFPELREDDEDSMKTTSGLLTTINTTSLPENFLVGLNPVNSLADSQNEDLTDKEKMARYRSAQVRVTLIEDSNFLGKLRIKIIKLVEIADGHNNKQVQSAANYNTDETPIHQGSEDNIQVTHENVSENEADDEEQQVEARSEASNFSLMMGEDMRQLKDMKAKISEKNTPSSITFLKATSLIMSALLIALTAIQLNEKKSVHDKLTYGFQAIKTSVMRHYYMADINYFTRVIFGYEGGYISSAQEQTVRYMLETMLEGYEEAEFEVSQAKMVQNQSDKNAAWIRLNTYNLLPDGTIALHNANINHAYYLYLASAERYTQIPFSEFHSSDGSYTTAESAFYFIRRNGLTTLRAASESVVLQYRGYYEDKTHQFNHFFLATMLIGITFLLAAMLVMLPKIFYVNKTNMKVLSLFGYILPQEVQKLADKCEQYMEEHLDEAAFQREYSSYFSENNSEEHQQLTQQPDESLIEPPHHKQYLSSVEEAQNESITSGGGQDFTLQMKEFSEHEDFRKPPVLISGRSALHSPGRSMVMSATARDDRPLINIKLADDTNRSSISVEVGHREQKKDKDKEKKEADEKEDNEELQEYLHERSKKLRNSPDHSKKGVIIKMGLFALIFIGFFLGDFLHEHFFFRNYRYAISHLALICERSSDLKYVQTFAQEEIYENNLTAAYPTYPAATVATKNARIEYAANVLTNQAAVKDSNSLPFPYQFDKYFETLLLYDNNNICDAYYTDKTLSAYTNCQTAGEGKLTLGMIQAETSILGTLETLIKGFYNTANRDKQTQINFLTSGDFRHVAELVIALKPIQNYLLEMFVEANSNYLNDTALIEDVKLILFLVVLFGLQVFVLLPYFERLRKHIFRTKALLNMIPMSMLKTNKTLAETFVSKEVFQALK